MAREDYFLKADIPNLILGILEAKIVTKNSNTSLIEKISDLCETIFNNKVEMDQTTRKEIRDLLRNKIFKPVGRSKPSSEYLFNAALKGETFPSINNIVDINNYISLSTNCPLCIFDKNKISFPIDIRLGLKDESYVFNNSGQTIDLNSLLMISDGLGPFGNPVKDSMRTKISEQTNSIFGIIYSSKIICDENKMKEHLELFKTQLIEHAEAEANTTSYFTILKKNAF